MRGRCLNHAAKPSGLNKRLEPIHLYAALHSHSVNSSIHANTTGRGILGQETVILTAIYYDHMQWQTARFIYTRGSAFDLLHVLFW